MMWEFCHYLYPMQFLLPSVYAALFIFIILKMNFFTVPAVSKKKLVILFLLKLIASAIVGLVYTFYYSGADFLSYFSDSSVLIHNLLTNDHQQFSVWSGSFEDSSLAYSSKVMIVLNAGIQLFSFGNLYVHFLFFCFFSFIGLIALLKILAIHFPDKKHLILPLFFIPGVLFWGSAPLKEAIIVGAAGLLIYLTDFGLRKKYSFVQVLFAAIFVLLLFTIKMYVFLALAPALICNFIVSHTSNKLWILKYLGVFFAFNLIAVWFAFLNPDLNILKQLSDKQAKAISEAKGGVFLVNDKHFISVDYENEKAMLKKQNDSTYKIVNGSSYLMWDLNNMADTTFVTNSNDSSKYIVIYKIKPANSIIPLKRIAPAVGVYIMYAPTAFLNTLIHPTLFEIKSWFHLFCAIENLGVMFLFLICIFFFDRKVFEKKEIIFFCFTFSIIVFVIIGTTIPAIGAIVRYRTTALLMLVIACFLLTDQEKLKKALFRK
jgi:hypothetical protein